MVAFDGSRTAEENAAAMEESAASVVTGAVTTASRNVALNGFDVRKGAYLGLSGGEPVAGGDDFEAVAEAVVESLLAQPRGLLTILSGEGAPELNGLLERLAERHPELELDVQDGGQPHYHLLLSAE
jgi:dihydroxyacetone kinase-like predicted kinase